MPDVRIPALPLRSYQRAVLEAVMAGTLRVCLAWGRRLGKTSALLALTSWVLSQRVGTAFWIARTSVEGRRIVWDGQGADGRRLLDVAFPAGITASEHHNEMRCELKNGAAFQVLGGDESSRIRGVGAPIIVIDEFAFFSEGTALDVARPIITESGGILAVSSTPNGKNWFWALASMAKDEPGWFYSRVDVTQAYRDAPGEPGGRVITDEQLAEDRRAMRPELFAAEYMVSFDEPIIGAVFADELRKMTEEGRICDVPEMPLPVEVAYDVGAGANAACVVFQRTKGGSVRVIESMQSTGGGSPELFKALLRKGYAITQNHMGHDAGNRSTGDNTSPQSVAYSLGLRNIKVLPRAADVVHEIDQVRLLMPRLWIDSTKAGDLVTALRHYTWDERERRPKPSPYNHLVDALRYCAIARPYKSPEEKLNEVMMRRHFGPKLAPAGAHEH
jgi:phage terminase large subunit